MRLDRLNDIEQYIIDKGSVSLNQLVDKYNVSFNTIRRDINELLVRGNIKKVYGGVSTVNNYNDVAPLPINVRSEKNREVKQLIGRLASSLVEEGDVIFLDSGSTTPTMLPYLENMNNITVITHSLNAMYEASRYPNIKIISLGGIYNATTSSFVGISTIDALKSISVNKVFIAATGVSLEWGLTNTTYFEAEIKRRVMKCSNKIILMADHSKFGYSSTISFFRVHNLHAIVTDKRPDDNFMDVIEANKIILMHE